MTESQGGSDRRRRVHRLFMRALTLEGQARAAFLARLRDEDADLAADVGSLVAAARQSEAEGFLATPPPVLTVRPWATSRADAGRDHQVGERIGSYSILRRIARGGMGTIYLAERSDAQYRQRVALKVVRPGLDTEDVLRRFRIERQVLADLAHPNIARLLDGGMTDDGRPYLVMEFIDGRPILEYCDHHRLSLDRRLALFRHVCLAVHHAHRKLVVHRDLKPSNVLVTADGRPKLLDFGIAKLLASGPEDPALTRPGVHVMSPEYASPEQVRGGPITTATDVYGLGLVLYELLSGRPAQRLSGTGWDELDRVVCRETPAPPSRAVSDLPAPSDAETRPPAATGGGGGEDRPTARRVAATRGTTPERLRRRLGDDLDTIVLTALHKDPDRRYASAEQMADDLRRHLKGLPVRARRDTVRYRARKFVGRHVIGLAASILLLLTLVAGIAGTSWQARIAADERDRAREEATKAEVVATFLTDLFRASDPLANPPDDSVTVTAVLDRARERLPSALEDQGGIRADLLTVLGEVYTNLGRYDDARDALREAVELRRAVPNADSSELARDLLSLAGAHAQEREFLAAEPLYREGVKILRDLAAAAPGDSLRQLWLAVTLSRYARTLRDLGGGDRAVSLAREAVGIREKLEAPGDPGRLAALVDLAYVLRGVDRIDEAEAIYRHVLETHRETGALEPHSLAPLLNNLAYLLMTREEYGEAEALYREAIEVHREVFGAGHPRTLMLTTNLAGILNRQGRYAELEVLSRRVLALQHEHRPPGHWRIGAAHQSLGRFLSDRGRWREAEAEHTAALGIFEAGLGPDHPWTAHQRSLLGGALLGQGRFSEAEPLLLRGLADLEASDRDDAESWSPEAARRVVELYESLDRPREADRYRSLALQVDGP